VEAFARTEYARLCGLAQQSPDGVPREVRISELLDHYETSEIPLLAQSTRRSYRYSLVPIRWYFVDKLGDPPLDRIGAGLVRQFLQWRRSHAPDGSTLETPLSNRSVAKERGYLSRMFEIAERLEMCDRNPVARIEVPKSDGRDPVILTGEEYERLVAECAYNPMLYLYALLLGETGMRSESEAMWIRWEHVSLEERFIWIHSNREHRTKSGRGRWVPMTDRLVRAMARHVAQFRWPTYHGRPSDWVLHHVEDRRTARAGNRIGSLRTSFKAACRRAALPDGFVRHDLRHRRVTVWLGEGKNPVHVKEAVGHADLATTMRYTHLSREHLRSLIEDPNGA
jgi:site-specific recombinase XerD